MGPFNPPPAGVVWEWKGPVDRDGYGKVMFNGRSHYAHRAAYEIVHGPIPTGLVIRHRNDTPVDVNPNNLEPGTNQDNVDDMVMRGRNHRPPSKLRASDIHAIRRRRNELGETLTVIADDFGISIALVSLVARRKRWANI